MSLSHSAKHTGAHATSTELSPGGRPTGFFCFPGSPFLDAWALASLAWSATRFWAGEPHQLLQPQQQVKAEEAAALRGAVQGALAAGVRAVGHVLKHAAVGVDGTDALSALALAQQEGPGLLAQGALWICERVDAGHLRASFHILLSALVLLEHQGALPSMQAVTAQGCFCLHQNEDSYILTIRILIVYAEVRRTHPDPVGHCCAHMRRCLRAAAGSPSNGLAPATPGNRVRAQGGGHSGRGGARGGE
eukprot:1153410-Pelagomonas_calceolata.AAC.4